MAFDFERATRYLVARAQELGTVTNVIQFLSWVGVVAIPTPEIQIVAGTVALAAAAIGAGLPDGPIVTPKPPEQHPG